jgi:hypothetical protein
MVVSCADLVLCHPVEDEVLQGGRMGFLTEHEQTSRLLSNPGLCLVIFIQTLSAIGDSFSYVAAPLLADRVNHRVIIMVNHRAVFNGAGCLLYGLISDIPRSVPRVG